MGNFRLQRGSLEPSEDQGYCTPNDWAVSVLTFSADPSA